MMFKKSKNHLHEMNETYLQHLGFALCTAITMLCGAVLITIHAFIPSLCQTSGSKRICKLAEDIRQRKEKCSS